MAKWFRRLLAGIALVMGLLSLLIVGAHVVVNIFLWRSFRTAPVSEVGNLFVFSHFGLSGLGMLWICAVKNLRLLTGLSVLVVAVLQTLVAIVFIRDGFSVVAVLLVIPAAGMLCASVLSILRWYEFRQQARNASPVSPAVKAVIARGTRVVNFPVQLIMVGVGLGGSALGMFVFKDATIAFIIASLILGFVLGWLWWSYAVPRWRKWALQQPGVSPDELQAAAQAALLVWPKGHFLEKTEFRIKE